MYNSSLHEILYVRVVIAAKKNPPTIYRTFLTLTFSFPGPSTPTASTGIGYAATGESLAHTSHRQSGDRGDGSFGGGRGASAAKSKLIIKSFTFFPEVS